MSREPEILTPTTLNRLVRTLLDDALPPVWVEGELSNLARPASGHLYFTLKDSGAQIRCAMFRPRAQGLRFRPADGQLVRVSGKVGLYEPRGDYQLIVGQMDEAGEGALQRAFELLKRKLAAEGLLAQERKRRLPTFPHRLAVITSPSGAAVRDVLSVLQRRFPLLPVDVLPAPVQGAEAVPALRERLRQANACGRYDVILMTRGGGSLEDLWAFNDEQLARDIAASAVPVVAAIGHEIDLSLAELAADLRAPTPSAAAEAISPDGAALARQLELLDRRLARQMRRELERLSQGLDSARLRLQNMAPARRLAQMNERAQGLFRRLIDQVRQQQERRGHVLARLRLGLRNHDPRRGIERRRERLVPLRQRLDSAELQRRRQAASQLRELARALHAVSPMRTLDRGYAILLDPQRRVLTDAGSVRQAGSVTARMSDGEIGLTVTPDRPTP